ncbi:MAG TPA: TrbI/VirB10 family protein [Deltaproteobacteria bacterium]|nr:TrbI/VirB10 family protein [Deltaproteobacteria bacterium]
MKAITDFWKNLSPENKRKASIAGVVLVVIIIGLSVWGKSDKPKISSKEATSKEISLDPKMAQNAIFEGTQRKLDEQERVQEDFKRELNETKRSLEDAQQKIDAIQKQRIPGESKTSSRSKNMAEVPASFPMPPNPGSGISSPTGNVAVPPPPEMNFPAGSSAGLHTTSLQQLQLVGDISIVSGKPEQSGDPEKKGGGGKNEKDAKDSSKKRFYLPPCIIKSSLIVGVRAPTMGDAKKDPVPLLFRVKAPAILPNYITSGIQGCFATSEGIGKLSDERVHVRLIGLSCIGKDGRSIIDQKITGYAVDEDGVVGLAGIVTARYGSMVARSFLAGMLEGAGDAVKASTSTISTSVEGSTQIISSTDWNNIAKAGVGGGLANASKELQEFFMAFAKEATPILEVGASKPCTLVISQGTYLEVKTEEVYK